MSRTCARGEGTTRQTAIDDLAWRVHMQAGIMPLDEVHTYRDEQGRWVAAHRMPEDLIGPPRTFVLDW